MPHRQADPRYQVEILERREQYRFHSLFRVVEVRLRHGLRDGSLGAPQLRVDFERGAAAAVLLHDPRRDEVVLVRQFRYPAYAALTGHSGPSIPESTPELVAGEGAWLLEIPAGILEAGDEDIEELARREVLEEVGYQLRGELRRWHDVFPSPGACSERVTIFYAQVEMSDRIAPGGGVAGEGEDIEVVVLPVARALALLRQGDISDAKTVIALQALALERDCSGIDSPGGSF